MKDNIETPFCACGCGEKVKWGKQNKCWNKYVRGHQSRNQIRGSRPCSEETKEKISKANRGRKFTEEHRKKLSEAHKGVPLSETHRTNSGLGHRGLKRSEETKRKISEALKGHPLYIDRIKDRTGEEGYCDQWYDYEFRRSCRKGYCEECGITEMLSLVVYSMYLNNHHIDLDKLNCHPDNLKTLCSSCHTKLHHKFRKKRNHV